MPFLMCSTMCKQLNCNQFITNTRHTNTKKMQYGQLLHGAIRVFLFMSILSGHLTLLWYYPLWSLSFTGAELSLLVLPLAPILARFMPIEHEFKMWIVACLFGLYLPANCPFFGYHFTDLPVSVRVIVSAGGLLLSTALIFPSSNVDINRPNAHQWMAGLMLVNLTKFAFVSNNPIWPIVYEDYCLLLLLACLIGLYLLGEPSPVGCSEYDSDNVEYHQIPSGQTHRKTIKQALNIGAWLYLFENFMSEPTTVQLWSMADSYNKNIIITSDLTTLMIMVITALVAFKGPRIRALYIMASAIVFYYFPMVHEVRLLAGVCMLSFLFACLPAKFMIQERSCNAKATSLAMLVYIALSIAHMAGVAYAFMPMGWVLRERTDLVLFGALLLSQLGSLDSNHAKLLTSYAVRRQFFKTLSVMLAVAVVIRSAKLHLKPNALKSHLSTDNDDVSLMIRQDFDSLPIIRIGIWAVHFGIDKNLRSSEHRMSRLIESLDLDVIGLVESDLMRPLMGNRDLGRLVKAAMTMKYNVDYGPSPRANTWGCTLLSKHQIVRSKHYLLPSPDGEIACAILAELEVKKGTRVQVLMAHNGQEEDKEGRKLQTEFLADLVRQNDHLPLLYAGYLVAKPHSVDYLKLFKPTPGKSRPAPLNHHTGPLYDIDPDIQDRWCLYIGHNQRNTKPLSFSRLHHGGITDTELQAAAFAVLPPKVDDHDSKWSLITRHARMNHASLYFSRWQFGDLNVCREQTLSGGVCEHHYHLQRTFY